VTFVVWGPLTRKRARIDYAFGGCRAFPIGGASASLQSAKACFSTPSPKRRVGWPYRVSALLTQPCFCRTLPASIPPVYLIYLSYLNSGVAFPHITCELGSLQWLPARVMSVLPRWHTQRCGRCQNSRYLYGQTRALPLSSTTCSARTSPSTILPHRPPVTRSWAVLRP